MPLAQLAAVPKTLADLQAWQFANVANHRDIIREVMLTKGLFLIEYPLQPFDPEDPTSLQTFLNAHQAMHGQLDQALGLDSYNLSEVDWSSPTQLNQWILAHYNEHQAASSLLGVS